MSTPGAAIDGIRNWAASGAWEDATPDVYPDWLQVDFSGSKTIDEINVFSVTDDYTNPTNPTETTTFSGYGLVNFDVDECGAREQRRNCIGFVAIVGGKRRN